ncbi:duodenase-1-like [Kryptolebias marmoratus]|uniref:duodenase-1-like n=1 Tax=Kryptolebias marmoratus TaxID=37003 RepID=UPI0007F8690F|nr:duodenase-1-like [Kryptolebias marmoratus]
MHSLGKLLIFHFLLCSGEIVHGFKIINGNKAPENSMQYMVSLQSKFGFHLCGGFLIREDVVVTAAHCDELEPYQILVGSHNLKGSNRRLIKIQSRCKHPDYKTVGLGNDIMLLKLSEKVPLNNIIKTIPLPKPWIYLKDNQICSVAGWGKTLNSHDVDDLQVVNVSIINPKVCQQQWNNELPPNVICAGGYNTNKGFCQGDSGGPLVCDGKAVGVVSFNRNTNCKYPDAPNVYTDISKYLPWINKFLMENKCPL